MLFLAVSGSAFLKRKRTGDPGLDRMKDERRRRRLVKALKKMEKKDRQMKPLIEMEVPAVLHTEAAIRSRNYQPPKEVM